MVAEKSAELLVAGAVTVAMNEIDQIMENNEQAQVLQNEKLDHLMKIDNI